MRLRFGSGSEVQTLGDDSNSRQKFQSPISKTFAWTLKFFLIFFLGDISVTLLIIMIPTVHVHVQGGVQNVELMKKLSLELVPMELFLDLYLLRNTLMVELSLKQEN